MVKKNFFHATSIRVNGHYLSIIFNYGPLSYGRGKGTNLGERKGTGEERMFRLISEMISKVKSIF